jgi:tryptophan-rich sensory protein
LASLQGTAAGRSRLHELLALGGFILLCLVVAAIGGAVTATSIGDWYTGLAKPDFNPPNGVFGPVWTILYLMIAFAGWRIWRRPGGGAALALWSLQLALNLLWSILFFGLHLIGWALVDILALLAAIIATAWAAARVDRLAAWLLGPYLLWVAFAAVLTASIWRLNG